MQIPEISTLKGGLIVSCQAAKGSPLDDAFIISALALAAAQRGAVGVRINGPSHIAAVRARVHLPIIGIEKMLASDSEVYITPTLSSAERVAGSGATIIALDATLRKRPRGEKFEDITRHIHEAFGKPVMADIATFEEGMHAAECGADIVATTLCSYTKESSGVGLPAFNLVERLAASMNVPIICEGGIASPEHVRRAFDCGAFAIVVGGAITGVDQLVQRFVAATPSSGMGGWPSTSRKKDRKDVGKSHCFNHLQFG